MTTRFQRYELRTTDVPTAHHFYAGVLGSSFWSSTVVASTLPERALVLGARPHWLGQVGTDDPLAATASIVAEGGQQLGPTLADADGSPRVIVRDPFGAMLAVGVRREAPQREPVSWHVLNTTDHAAAVAFYARLFGWHVREEQELPGLSGFRHRPFTWEKGGRIAGSITNAARLPAVHCQWLHFFAVDELDRTLARVRAEGGSVLAPVTSPSGARFAPVDDTQGAAFGLHQAAPG
jgi:predicted enzyme related to lactoylglutathione lyase